MIKKKKSHCHLLGGYANITYWYLGGIEKLTTVALGSIILMSIYISSAFLYTNNAVYKWVKAIFPSPISR